MDYGDMDDPMTDPIGAAIADAAGTVAAPAALRASVAREHEVARRRRRRGAAFGGGLVAVVAATIVALVLVLPVSRPTVTDAARLALAEPTLPAPGLGAREGTLDTSVSGVAFPTWPGWDVVGERAGKLDGRTARSVVYADADGRRVGYTIVAGDALDVPDGRRHAVDGTELTSFEQDGATIVTWEVDGHTCVLATEDGVPAENLVRFAATTY